MRYLLWITIFIMGVIGLFKINTPVISPDGCNFNNSISVSITANVQFQPTLVATAPNGNVWIGGNGYIKRMNVLTGAVYITYPISGNMYSMDIDSAGYIWIAGGSDIRKYNPTTGGLIQTLNVTGAYYVSCASNGDMWILSNNSILKKINPANGAVLATYTYGIYNSYSLDISPAGYIWISQQDPVNYPTYNSVIKRIDASNGAILNSYPMDSDYISQLYVAPNGNIWTVSLYNYLRVINPSNGALIIDRYDNNRNYNDIAVSPNGYVWVVTDAADTHNETFHQVDTSSGAIIDSYLVANVPASLVIVYYLNDGVLQTYSTPILLTASDTVHAYAISNEYITSETNEESYVLTTTPIGVADIRGERKTIFNNDFYVKHSGAGLFECHEFQPIVPRNVDGTITKLDVLVGSFTIAEATSPTSIMLQDDHKGYFTCIIDDTYKRYSKDMGRTWTA